MSPTCPFCRTALLENSGSVHLAGLHPGGDNETGVDYAMLESSSSEGSPPRINTNAPADGELPRNTDTPLSTEPTSLSAPTFGYPPIFPSVSRPLLSRPMQTRRRRGVWPDPENGRRYQLAMRPRRGEADIVEDERPTPAEEEARTVRQPIVRPGPHYIRAARRAATRAEQNPMVRAGATARTEGELGREVLTSVRVTEERVEDTGT